MFVSLFVFLFQSLVVRSSSLGIGLRVCHERQKTVVPRGVTGPFWEAWVTDWNLLGERELSLDKCDLLPGDGVRKSPIGSHFHEAGFSPRGVKNGRSREPFFPTLSLLCGDTGYPVANPSHSGWPVLQRLQR